MLTVAPQYQLSEVFAPGLLFAPLHLQSLEYFDPQRTGMLRLGFVGHTVQCSGSSDLWGLERTVGYHLACL
jgi:hypothetical protein